MQLKFLPSFVKRKGRITKKQTHSLSSLSEFSVKSVQEVEDFSKHFDKCYLAYANFILPRDIMQTSLRVRDFKYKNKHGKDVIFLCQFPTFRASNGLNE